MQQAYDQALDLTQLDTLRITKSYPGEPAWSIRIRRTSPGLPGSWEIDSAPHSIQDKLADAAFVHHLLDTLKTLRPALDAPNGPASSQGFEPPRAVLEWTEMREGKKQERKLILGDPYGLNGRFVIFAPKTTPVIAAGALLEMLGHATNWDSFRLKRLVTWDVDDVDVIRVAGHPYERVGTHWEKEKKDVTVSFLPRVSDLFHQRIQRWVDDKAETDRLEFKTADQGPVLQIELEDRKQKIQKITIYGFDGKLYAKNSSRVGWVELYPEFLRNWSDLTQAQSTTVKSGTKK